MSQASTPDEVVRTGRWSARRGLFYAGLLLLAGASSFLSILLFGGTSSELLLQGPSMVLTIYAISAIGLLGASRQALPKYAQLGVWICVAAWWTLLWVLASDASIAVGVAAAGAISLAALSVAVNWISLSWSRTASARPAS